ncbi:MAG: hypothetical protein H6563_02725 [Lewinellaceae bacterium]|nr:hypothetical protein [Lewinellaceae bacterium]
MKTFLPIISFLFLAPSLFAQSPLQIPFGNLRVRSIGPAVMSGRVTSITGVNSDHRTFYIGAANGGVWKTNNGGGYFQPIFDEQPQSIGSIAVDQAHPDTIWVGTGEPWVRNSTSVGTGLYRTTNGGKTWNLVGLENSERISNIILDPNDPATIYVAVQGHLWNANEDRGLYKSTDFGQTWERILYVDANTGCADLSMDPTNPDVLYASMWDHRRYPDFFQSGGPGSGLYKTTDGGKTWTRLTKDLPEGQLGRMAVAVAPSNPEVVYLTVECEQKEGKGLYRSDDAGQSWKKVSTDFNVTVRPFYFARLVVDPNDENKIYKCGLNLTVSEDGGKTFRTVASGVHSDVHAVWVAPGDSKFVVIGTDGGAYRSLDGGTVFEMFMDLPISQFYQVSVDDAKPFNVYGGLQDNGSWYGPSASPGGVENSDWDLSNWGDGFYSFPHPTNPDIIYSESQGGNLVRHNRRDGQTKDIKPLPEAGEPEYRFNWNAPIHISPNNPERLYFGGQFLFMTEDRGNSWTRLGPDLTTNDPQRQRQKRSGGFTIDNSGAENNATIYAIGESPRDEKVIWAGTDDGNLQVTADGGKTWTNVAPNIPGLPPFTWCSSVEPGHFDRNTCYATFDGHRTGDKTTYLFKTTDLGKTWTSLATSDIEGYAHIIREDLQAASLLFLGTEFGLYISLDGGLSWKRFENNLPKTAVMGLAIHPRDHALVIATHGRGIYIFDDLTPLRQITPEVVSQDLVFLETGPTYLKLARNGRPFGGAGNFTGENPDESASITYYLKKRHTIGKMSMAVYGPDGKLIKELPGGKSGGINTVSLPTRLPMPKAAPTNNRSALFGSAFPPTLPEGQYKVVITKGKAEYTGTFELIFDPDAEATYPAADRKLGHDTQMRLYDLTNQCGYVYFQLEAMHTQAADRKGQVTKKKLVEQMAQFAKETETLKNSLVSLEGDFYVDEDANIREDISTLYLAISQYPGKPSDRQLAKATELEQKMAEVQAKFDAFLERMAALNAELEKAGLEPMKVKTIGEYLE